MRWFEKGMLQLQYGLGRLFVYILAPAYFGFILAMGYRIRALSEFRAACGREFRNHRGPWIICANHLTMVDSMILIYALFSLRSHVTGFRMIPWNLPERDNFQQNPVLAVLCYLAKCIPVHRGGSRDEMAKTIAKCDYVLSSGQNLLIFPEGGRSRTSRVDKEDYSYGVGRFVKEFEVCRIMCLYLRGDGQDTFGNFPRFRETFTISMNIFRPERQALGGLRAQREYARQIIDRLANMEEEYFASHRERCRGLGRSGKSGKKRGCAFHLPRLHTR